MTGKEMRLKRLLSRNEKLVVAAMDHGGFMGPKPGLENPEKTCEKLLKADGVVMMPGMISKLAKNFTSSQSPPIIARILWNSDYCVQWNNQQSRHSLILTVSQALARGADIILASMSLNTGSEAADAENIALFSQRVQEAHELGIPLIGEYFPASILKMTPEQTHENIKFGCRAIAELGADMIKTFYTGDKFSEIVIKLIGKFI